MKTCSGCGVEQPLQNYYKNKTSKDGLNYHCKECCKNHVKAFRERNKDYNVDYLRNYHAEPVNRARWLHRKAKLRAKEKGLAFSVSIAAITKKLLRGTCERTGLSLSFGSHERYHFNPMAPSLDRENPFEGYTEENTKVVCNAYNLAKNQMTREEFVNFCKRVVEFNGDI